MPYKTCLIVGTPLCLKKIYILQAYRITLKTLPGTDFPSGVFFLFQGGGRGNQLRKLLRGHVFIVRLILARMCHGIVLRVKRTLYLSSSAVLGWAKS